MWLKERGICEGAIGEGFEWVRGKVGLDFCKKCRRETMPVLLRAARKEPAEGIKRTVPFISSIQGLRFDLPLLYLPYRLIATICQE